jgi:hypothetical protein
MDSTSPRRGGSYTGAAYNGVVGWLRARALLAFDAGSLSGAALRLTLSGRRLERLRRAPLAPGVIAPSPVEPNLRQPDVLGPVLEALVREIGVVGASATLILPDGIARVAVLDPPAGVEPAAFARYRLGAGLPYPAAEAIVDFLRLDARRVLAVAVRRTVVEPYEAMARSVGLDVERVLLSPVAAFEGLRRLGPAGPSTVDVILGDAGYSIAAWKDGEVRVFRSRRRDPGTDEASLLRQEILRTATLAGDGQGPRVRVVGPGSGAVVRALQELGARAEPGWRATGEALPVESAEIPWLGVGL